MALFFFVIGMEVRREWSLGELRDRTRVTLPVHRRDRRRHCAARWCLVLPHRGVATDTVGGRSSQLTRRSCSAAIAIVGPDRPRPSCACSC